MGDVVKPHRMEPGVAEQDFQHALRGRVALEDDADVVPDSTKHLSPLPWKSPLPDQ
jgi:hypothetical protein